MAGVADMRTRPGPRGAVSHCATGGRPRMADPAGMATKDVNEAPDPDSEEFLTEHNPVEKVSPGTTADAVATDATLIPTDPAPSTDPR